MKEKIMLIDGNSLLFRAFYALPLLQTSQGIFTNGVYGFFTMFNRVVAEEEPSHIVVAFDKSRDTFRKELYQDYKANRSAPPDELRGQFNLLREVLKARNIVYLEAEGYEADDIIGTLCHQAAEKGMDIVVVTGDGDALQLVSEQVRVIMTRKGISDIELYDPAKVKEKWEVNPEQMRDIKGLMGDSSDNIPGVPGVGVKTAIKLIKEFGELENLYQHLDQVKGKKLVERLQENREQAFLSRELGTIVTNMELEKNMDNYLLKEADYEKLKKVYKELEFNNFLRELEDRTKDKIAEQVSGAQLAVTEITTNIQMADLIQTAEEEGISLMVQSDQHHPMWGSLKGLYMESAGQIFYLNFGESPEEKIEWLKPMLEAGSIKKYLHNAKFLQVLLKRHGVKLEGIAGDTMLMTYVIDPAFDGGELSLTMYRYLNVNADRSDYVLLVSRIKELFQALADLTEDELKSLYYKVELPLSSVLADMEYAGIKVDGKILWDISIELSQRIAQDERKIYELARSEFNINSPKQMGKILFEDLGLRVIKKTKTGYSTGAEILEELYDDHEIIPLILDYRQLAKLKSTYADALQGSIHPQSGRIHTIFKQAQTATGRLSSIEPNLQNIPIRMEEGRRIRRAFTADDQHVILSADYSQIDLRSLAHISEDDNLINTFRAGIDIHTRTAAEIFKVPLEAVTDELRYRAKAVNFGIIYGISDFGLARDTGVSRKEARIYIDNYLDSYPGVRRYMEDIVQFGQEYGYVETILKRRRYLPDLNAKNKILQSFARRMALNTPIQGTSADIIKLAMIEVDRQIKSRGLKSRLLLQVHDDLILEVPEKEIEEVAILLTRCMENAYQLKVPLIVSLKKGSNWYDMQTFTPGQ